jgi:hydroxyacylglutathione hydrolase
VICQTTSACVAVDPGAGATALVSAIEEENLDLQAVLLTHAHLDHVEGISDVRARHPGVPIWLHPDELNLYRGVHRQAAMFGLTAEPQPEPTDEIIPGESFQFGDCKFDVSFAPGHSPGHVIFVSRPRSLALVGDVVFQGSIGRTDLPGGSFETLMASIRREILILPDETILFPGHGPATSVGQERDTNPFLAPQRSGGLA